jgi:hypothetical protein
VDKDNEKQEIFSERVRAGKRTYFFDVKATRSNDYYLTITESKRKYKDDGYTYEKHKIFLYKEDFDKFVYALNNTVNHVKNELMPDLDFSQFDQDNNNHNNDNHGKAVEKENEKEKEATESGIDTELKWD